MDLDQLKLKWQERAAHDLVPELNVTQMLRQPAKSALSALKRSFRKQIVLLAVLFLLIFYQFRNKDLFINTFFWWYLFVCLSLCLFFYANLRLVKRLERTDQPLTSHLLTQLSLIEKRMRWHRIFTRVAVIVLIILAETLPFFSDESMVLKWHAVDPLLRVVVYLAFILFQYFVGKRLAQKRYGQHLQRLKGLLNDTL